MDATVLMDLEEKVKAWPDQSDSAIAPSIFADYGFDADVRVDADPVRQANDVTDDAARDRHPLPAQARRAQRLRVLRRRRRPTGAAVGPLPSADAAAAPQAMLSVNMGTETNLNDFSGATTCSRRRRRRPAAIDAQRRVRRSRRRPRRASPRDQGGKSTVAAERPRDRLLSRSGLSQHRRAADARPGRRRPLGLRDHRRGLVNAAALGQVLRAKQPVLVRGAGEPFQRPVLRRARPAPLRCRTAISSASRSSAMRPA